MRAEVLIVGQGLAGTLLAWEFERAGISFSIADRGHALAATKSAAGIINPITGRRLVKSWRIDELLPRTRAAYRELEAELGVAIWNDVRVRRLFADERERRVFAEKQARGELTPFARPGDDLSFWIEGAARLNLASLLDAARERWRRQARLVDSAMEIEAEMNRSDLVIDCSGAAVRGSGSFAFVPWEFSKGELIEIAVEGLEPGVILSRRHWIAPTTEGRALVGATHEPGAEDMRPTEAGRAALEASAHALLLRPFVVTAHRVGCRVHLPDRRPVVGRHPANPRLGICNGLAGKGALLAPWLARQWSDHVKKGCVFDPELDVARFFKPPGTGNARSGNESDRPGA